MEDPIPIPTLKTAKEEFSGTEGAYLLPHNIEEIKRLQIQHEFIKAATKDKLTSLQLGSGARVLDCGCADGTWLWDLSQAEKDRSLSLHGVDIGSALFRNHPELDLRQHDIRTPFPTEWQWKDSFDLVHQRLLVWGIGTDEWTPVVKSLTDAVKPGGYIQLAEAEWVLPSYSEQQPQQYKLSLVQSWSTQSQGMDVHIWKRLPGLLEEMGFIDINIENHPLGYGATSTREQDRTWTAELLPKSFRHLAARWPEGGIEGVAKTEQEYLTFLDELVKEMKAIGYTPQLKWITAKKPSV